MKLPITIQNVRVQKKHPDYLDNRIFVRVSTADREKLTKIANRLGLTASGLTRQLILDVNNRTIVYTNK